MTLSKNSLDRNVPVPLYYQLEELLINEIQANNFKEDEPILTEMELSKIFGISRPTIRQAINDLVNEGYLYRLKGKGTFVAKSKINQEFIQMIDSFNAEIYKKGLIPRTKVLQQSIILSNEEISKSLQIEINEKVTVLKRLRYADKKQDSKLADSPLLVVTTYIPYYLCKDIEKIDFEKESLYKTLDNRKLKVERVRRTFEARKANLDAAKLLQIKEGDPVLYFETIGFLENNTPIEYSKCSYRGDRNSFVVEIRRN
jgi:GntR family transcriptional regulator